MSEYKIFGFEAIWRLWFLLIIPVLIGLYILVVRRRLQHGMRYTNTTVLGEVMPKQSQWLRHVIVALLILSLVGLGVAWARPLGIQEIPQERATVVLVIDVSWSMMATDVDPTRLDAAKLAASDFVKSVPDGFNIALVSLSGNPSMRMSPTADHNAILHLISVLTPQDSSAIGDALMTALAAVAEAPPSSKDDDLAPAAVILLSDGGNTHGQSPLQIALQAKDQGIPIYTISFGTQNGYIDLDDERFHVPPDDALMREIANISGGEFFSATNLSQLDRAYRNIHSEIGYVKVKKEITATWAWPSLVLAFIAAAGAVVLGVRFR